MYILSLLLLIEIRLNKMAVINIKDFPDDPHRKAKSEVALEGIFMKALFINAIQDYLQKKEVIIHGVYCETTGKVTHPAREVCNCGQATARNGAETPCYGR